MKVMVSILYHTHTYDKLTERLLTGMIEANSQQEALGIAMSDWKKEDGEVVALYSAVEYKEKENAV